MLSSGDRVVRFIESFLTLGGSFLGQPFRLLDWQKETLRDIYLLDENGDRLRRTYVLGIPRKNGKSQLGAALALYHLIVDTADAAPMVISAAGDRKQARLVFDEARRMVLSSPELRAVCTVHRDVITCSKTGGSYRAVSADAGLQQGLNPSFVVFDELHVFKNSELFEALQLGSAARRSPLTLVISTAGFDLDSPLGRLYSYGLRIDGHRLNGTPRPGEVKDPAFGMTWFGPEPGVDTNPADRSLWERFNPSWPIINPKALEASFTTTHESAFIRYHLNGWTSAESAWLPHGVWENLSPCSDECLGLPAETPCPHAIQPGEPVVLGFDGAWKGDSTGLVAVSLLTGRIEVLGHWEAPPNDPDWRVPYADVMETIRDACGYFSVREIAADPYRWELALQELLDEGLPVVEFNTNSLPRMVPATQTFYDACLDAGISHDGHPALARHIGNAVLKEDAKGARITKEYRSSKRHIDLAVAAVIAVFRARAQEADPAPAASAQLLVF